jgi:hypothetical protein
MVEVKALVDPEMLVEIEVDAVAGKATPGAARKGAAARGRKATGSARKGRRRG